MLGVCNCLCRLRTTSLVGSNHGSQYRGVQIVCLGSDGQIVSWPATWFHFPGTEGSPVMLLSNHVRLQVSLSEAFIQVQRHLHTRHRGWKQAGSFTLWTGRSYYREMRCIYDGNSLLLPHFLAWGKRLSSILRLPTFLRYICSSILPCSSLPFSLESSQTLTIPAQQFVEKILYTPCP